MRKLFLINLALFLGLVLALTGTAKAEGSLEILNESLDLSLEPSLQDDSQADTPEESEPENEGPTPSYPGGSATYTKTTKATVFVFNSTDQDLTNLQFCAEVEAEQTGEGAVGSVPVIISSSNHSIGSYDTDPFRLMMQTDVPLSDWSDRAWWLRQLKSVWWEVVPVFSPQAPSEWSNPSG